MACEDTLPELWRPLMEAPSVETPRCCVCGRAHPLNRHHVVPRSRGKLYRHGVEVPKPTVVLCGLGNNLRDADGRPYCHGMAHHGMLHFRWVAGGDARSLFKGEAGGGHLEYLLTAEPTRYEDALGMGGWRRMRRWL